VFASNASEVAFSFLRAIGESSNNLGKLLSVLDVRDEVVLGVADTLVAAQAAGSKAAKDEDQDMVY
jgi:hypothetical protein